MALQLSYVVTRQIWIKTQCATVRTLSLLDVNGVEHFELFQRLSGSETTMQMSLCSEVGGAEEMSNISPSLLGSFFFSINKYK